MMALGLIAVVLLWVLWWSYEFDIPIPVMTLYVVWVRDNIFAESDPIFLGIAFTIWGAKKIIFKDRMEKLKDFSLKLDKLEWFYEPIKVRL